MASNKDKNQAAPAAETEKDEQKKAAAAKDTTKAAPAAPAPEVPTVDMSAVRAEIAKMLAEAKAEADRIIAEAAAKVSDPEKEKAERLAADKARGEELVEVKLFKDNDKYKNDVFVSCNGETCAIKRGVKVKIKRKFAEILDNSEHQDYETSVLIEQKAAEWEAANK